MGSETEFEPTEGQDEQDLTPAAGRILEAASRLFYEQGIRAVGVDAIVEEADVAKVTLYNNFGSKDELAAAYVRHRRDLWQSWIEEFVGEAQGPESKILSVFEALERWMEESGFRGSAAINAFSELPDLEHPARIAAQEYKEWSQGHLRDLAAGVSADDAERLAERIWILLEGATITSMMELSIRPVREAKSIVRQLL